MALGGSRAAGDCCCLSAQVGGVAGMAGMDGVQVGATALAMTASHFCFIFITFLFVTAAVLIALVAVAVAFADVAVNLFLLVNEAHADPCRLPAHNTDASCQPFQPHQSRIHFRICHTQKHFGFATPQSFPETQMLPTPKFIHSHRERKRGRKGGPHKTSFDLPALLQRIPSLCYSH